MDYECPLTSEQFRELLDYDPDTGLLTWREWRGSARAGAVAGYKNADGYIKFLVRGRTHLSHRIIWSMVYGVWPKLPLDHINRVRDDNRLSNLRLATQAQNMMNLRRKPRFTPDGTPIPTGANLHRKSGRWIGRIRANRLFHYLGSFGTAAEAGAAYRAAARVLHGAFAQTDG
jgi:hypothetical protein